MSQSGSMSQAGSMSQSLAGPADKYLYFSDSNVKDRIAFLAPMHTTTKVKIPGKELEPSQRCAGWDKYFFFGVSDGTITNTARRGRSRPAISGPQTFMTEPFAPEDIARERERIEALGPRTSYTEKFSQFQRSPSSTLGPPGERVPPRTPMARVASDSVLGSSSGLLAATHSSEGPPGQPHVMAADDLIKALNPYGGHVVERHGPHWPPPTRERPDSLKTRRGLFRGQHRTLVDLYATDRPSPQTLHYSHTTV